MEVNDWCTTVCSMTDPRSTSRSRTLQSWKSFHFQKLSPLPFTMGAGNWPLFLKLGHSLNLVRSDFDICPSFCVTWLWTWQKRQLRRVDSQSQTGLIYLVNFFRNSHETQLSGFLQTILSVDFCVFLPVILQRYVFTIVCLSVSLTQDVVGVFWWNLGNL